MMCVFTCASLHVRLYMCGDTLTGLAARLFQGHMTSFKHPDSGFYPVSICQDI